jgi:exodeoxyribonuclease VIII
MTGILHGLDAAKYHDEPALGSSALNALARSPWHYWAEYLSPGRPERVATAAMAAGTLAHCAILEPDELDRRYVARPAWVDGRTKDGKAWIAEAEASGAEVITAEQMATAQAQRAAVLEVPELAQLLASGQAEVSSFSTDEASGVACKARVDWVHTLADGRVLLVDLKTTQDPSPEEFARSVWKYGYHRQQAHYAATWEAAGGPEIAGFVFAAVSSAYPFLAVAHMLDDDALQRGMSNRRTLLQLYAECSAKDNWPRPFAGLQLLSLPAWAKETIE